MIAVIPLLFTVLLFDRRWALLAILAGTVFVTQGSAVVIFGINMEPIRFIELAGLTRVLVRNEQKSISWNSMDKFFVLFNVVYLSVYIVRCNLQPGAIDVVSYRFGYMCDALICYFVFRSLIDSIDVFNVFVADMIVLLLPFAGLMLVEAITGHNYFSSMGGVPATPILRDGFYRCQASFRHAITAGSVGSTLLPIFVYVCSRPSHRFRGIAGIIVSLIIVGTSHSSGPLMSAMAGIIAWVFWIFRDRMCQVRIGIVVSLIALHLIMNAPVWFLIAKVSAITGGDGWHRANLIDQFIKNTSGWWLMGMPLELTEDWAATKMPWGAVDITNQYVAIGLNGGILSLAIFVMYFKICFASIGNGLKKVQTGVKGTEQNILLWALGATLFSHMVNIIAVSYWDQSYVIWYMTLASISSVAGCVLSKNHHVTNAGKGYPTENIAPSRDGMLFAL